MWLLRMKSDEQRETLSKGQFPLPGEGPVLYPHASLQILIRTQGTRRPLAGCRGPRWRNLRRVLPRRTPTPRLDPGQMVHKPVPKVLHPSPCPHSFLPRLNTPASGSAQTLAGGVLRLYQLVSSSYGRSQLETKLSLCFLHRHSQAQKSQAK